MRSLFERMQEIPDPRSSRKKKHDCAEILTCLVMAYMTGRTALRRAVSWITANEAQLKKYMKLKGGPASVSTISRLLSGIDEEIFTLTFSDWAFQLLNSNGRHLIIDGKGLRGAASKVRLENVPYMLNVIDAATQMVVAQMPIEEKKGRDIRDTEADRQDRCQGKYGHNRCYRYADSHHGKAPSARCGVSSAGQEKSAADV